MKFRPPTLLCAASSIAFSFVAFRKMLSYEFGNQFYGYLCATAGIAFLQLAIYFLRKYWREE